MIDRRGRLRSGPMMLSLTQSNPRFVIATLGAKIRLTLRARLHARDTGRKIGD
jgi:hypothetical protein